MFDKEYLAKFRRENEGKDIMEILAELQQQIDSLNSEIEYLRDNKVTKELAD